MPKFLQIYFIGDNTKQADQHCSNVIQTKLEVVLQLQDMLHKENHDVQSLKCAVEKMTPEYTIVIHSDKTPAGEREHRFNVPSTSEMAVIQVGEHMAIETLCCNSETTTSRELLRHTHHIMHFSIH